MNLNEDKDQRLDSVGFFIPADHIGMFSAAIGHSSPLFQFLEKILKYTGHITGQKTGIEIPEPLLSQNPELWKHLSIVNVLRTLGYIDDLTLDIFPYPDEPPLYVAEIRVSHKEKKIKKPLHLVGAGFDFFSQKKALQAATGESVERWIFGNLKPNQKDITRASYDTVQRKKISALNPTSLAGINPQLRKNPPAGYHLAFDDATPFEWIQGVSLTAQKPLLIPAQLVFNAFAQERFQAGEPMLRLPNTNGMATGSTLEKAILAGSLEIIERDAFMITWLNKISPLSISIESITDKALQDVFRALERYNLEPHLLYLPTDMPVHAVLAVIIDRSKVAPAVSVGAAASFEIKTSIKRGLEEACGLHRYTRRSLEQARQKKRDLSFKDRSKIGQIERLLYWCDTEKIKDIAFLLKGEKLDVQKLSLYQYKKRTARQDIDLLVKAFKKSNLELSYVDISEKKIQKTLGFHTAIVVAPELQPLYLAENIPYHWGPRLQSVPKKCGIEPSKEINKEIHPFP